MSFHAHLIGFFKIRGNRPELDHISLTSEPVQSLSRIFDGRSDIAEFASWSSEISYDDARRRALHGIFHENTHVWARAWLAHEIGDRPTAIEDVLAALYR